MRYLAPAGTPITFADLSAWLKTVLNSSKVLACFQQEICDHFGVKHVFFLSTGRAAMVVLLQVLSEISGGQKDQVIIPSYTCFSVPSSIVKAGLKVRVCDINPCTLDYDYDKLSQFDFSRVLCIMPANLYGIPNDLQRLEAMAAKYGLYLIDDAAQSMGAKLAGQFSGTFGNAGIFSLDKGKVITSMNGGIIVTNTDEVAQGIMSKIHGLKSPTLIWSLSEVVKLFIYSIFLNPSRYWIPAKLPFLSLGSTVYTTDYPITKYNKLLCGIAVNLFKKLDEINRIRKANGQYYMEALRNIPWLSLPEIQENISPIYLRYPILVTEKKERERIAQELVRLGLGVSESFPSSIVDITELRSELFEWDINNHGGRTVASQILTLPTHPYVTIDDMEAIIQVIKNE